jgi:hypothetical protein
MADPIIPLDEFIGGITDANQLVVDERFIKPKTLDKFIDELITFLGVPLQTFSDAGMASSIEPGISKIYLKDVLKSIPKDLLNSNTISIVNWDLFLKSSEASGIKVDDNVKEYLPESYLVKHNEIVDSIAESYVDAAKGSAADLKATKSALDAVWLNEPFNGNVFAGQSLTDMNNTDTPFGAYMANVNQKVRDYVQTQTSTETPVTTTTMPASTDTTAPPSTTVPSSGSQPPSTYITSTGNTGASGEVLIPGLGGVESATKAAEMSLQEWMFQNPNSTYLDLMNLYGTKTVTGATSFGKRYGYSAGTEGEWNIRSFYDFPLQLKSENDIGKFQDDLRKAGFFNFEGGQLPLRGVIDSATTGAWSYFLKSAALSGMEPAQYLVKRIQEVGQFQWDQQVIGRDPDTIQSRANDLGSAILGRGLNAMEIKTLQDVVRGWEKQAVLQGNFADQPMDVDLNARMEKYLQNTYQDEAVWTNYANSRQATERYFGN